MMQEVVLFRWLLVIVFPEQVGFVPRIVMCDVSHRKFGMRLIYTVRQRVLYAGSYCIGELPGCTSHVQEGNYS